MFTSHMSICGKPRLGIAKGALDHRAPFAEGVGEAREEAGETSCHQARLVGCGSCSFLYTAGGKQTKEPRQNL